MSTVFLSYSSEQSEAASRIELSLKEDGHDVFRDRSSLPPGEAFDARIRASVEESDLFVFLISRESVSQGRYTLTELTFAEHKWGNPSGHVLPVLVEPVPRDAIPAFLRAVTILNPKGNLTAEVAAEVARMSASWWRRMIEPRRLVPAVVVALILAAITWTGLPTYLERREQAAEVRGLLEQSRSQAASGRYEDAWKLLEDAHTVAPRSPDVPEAQERLAMEWLRSNGLGFWTSDHVQVLVDRTLPVLSRGANAAEGEHLGNLLAHLGWTEYLRDLVGASGRLRTVEYYRRALDVDSHNVYAQAMWGFEILRVMDRSKDAIAAARQHFSAAVESGREREYVRYVEIAALLRAYSQVWAGNPDAETEAIRVAIEMRAKGETRPKGSLKRRLWDIYHFEGVTADHLDPLLRALPPAEHLATFRWLFPEDELSENQGPTLFNYLHVLAQVQERGGDRDGALDSYRRLLAEFKSKKLDSGTAMQIVDHANAAIKRLSG